MKYFKRHLKVVLASFLYICSAGFPAVAEDIEIFFGNGSSVSGLIKPNVLFVLDTSGSMTSIVDDGQGKSRLTHMKEALTDIITDANNVNMGLMRFTKPGGPILFPVANVDAALSDIESSAAASSVVVTLGRSSDDAEENSSGDVSLDSSKLELVEVMTGGSSIAVRVSSGNDDAEERADGSVYRTSTDLELIRDGSDQIVGIRFRNIAIPQGAIINTAEIEFEIDEKESGSTSLVIKGEADDDAAQFSSSDYDISSRSTTTNEVAWNNLPVKSIDELLTTPNLSGIVQDIVNRPGWVSGNDMAFVISGSGERVVEAYDGEPDAAPLLRITFGGTPTSQTIGLRFTGVNIPQGVTIDSATLEFSAAVAGNDTTSLTIQGQDNDNAATFSNASNDISGRATTTAVAAWNAVPAWNNVDETQTSTDISSVVQEIVNRNGWCGGSAMALIISGSGSRIAYAFDSGGSGAPVLRINYDENTIPIGGGCMSQVMTRRVSNGNDDVEESSSGAVNNSSSDLELVSDGSNQTIGVRFQNIQIPKDAVILSAVLNFEIDEPKSESTSLNIKGEAHDDALVYNASDSGNVSNRSTTVASVAWNNLPNLSVNTKLTSPDLSTIISEITSRSGWAAGNAISFVITGSGKRTVEAYNGEAGAAPQLVVMYSGGSGGSGSEKTVRDRLVELVNELQHKGGTPIVDSLYEAALYYRGDPVDYGKNRGLGSDNDKSKTRVSHPASYTGGTLYQASGCSDENPGATACSSEEIQGAPQYISPITDTCQANYIVMLTDGAASYNSSSSKIETMIGGGMSCVGSGNQKCGHEIVRFLNEEDQITTGMDDDQTIKTYTIGFNFSSNWLREMATEGGGSFYTADTADQLKTAFAAILREVADTESSFVSPATAVNQFNRLKHQSELYFAMFKPNDDPKWSGNLKRYGIKNNQIVDANGDLAVDSSTGFFKDSAISLWSASVDGKDVSKGGAANELTNSRNIYTYTGNYPITGAVSLTSHPLRDSNALISKGVLNISSETDAYRSDLLKWASGIDVKDSDGDSSTIDARTEMGDPIHSKPVLVTYGGTSASPDITLYMATNEGYLTAIDTDDGSEVFSFVPKELLPNLRLFYDNLSSTPHPYGLDGDITIWRNDANGDGAISTSTAGDFVYLYVGMRRGGKNYYALDVTDRSQPKLMWTIQGGSGDFAELAQTWSKPVRGKIKLNSVDKNVLIFGGGYDVDQDDATIPVTDDEGRAVYIVDAETGDRLWWASLASADLVLTDMDYSLPADIKVVDSDRDGYSDTLFVGDMHAQLWRFDIDNKNNTGAANLVTGGVIGDFGGNDEANNRRFYNAVDVSMVRYGGALYYSLGVGSGFRAHPLNTAIEDRFYLLRDANVIQKPADYAAYKATESELYDATANLIGEGVNKASERTLLKSKQGWYIKLNEADASFVGEKVLAESLTYKNQLLFTTYTPAVISTIEVCAASQLGTSRVYSINLFDATPTANRDGVGTEDNLIRSDRSKKLTKSGISPKVTIILTDVDGGDGAMALSGTDLIDGLDLDPIQKTYWKQKPATTEVGNQ